MEEKIANERAISNEDLVKFQKIIQTTKEILKKIQEVAQSSYEKGMAPTYKEEPLISHMDEESIDFVLGIVNQEKKENETNMQYLSKEELFDLTTLVTIIKLERQKKKDASNINSYASASSGLTIEDFEFIVYVLSNPQREEFKNNIFIKKLINSSGSAIKYYLILAEIRKGEEKKKKIQEGPKDSGVER